MCKRPDIEVVGVMLRAPGMLRAAVAMNQPTYRDLDESGGKGCSSKNREQGTTRRFVSQHPSRNLLHNLKKSVVKLGEDEYWMLESPRRSRSSTEAILNAPSAPSRTGASVTKGAGHASGKDAKSWR